MLSIDHFIKKNGERVKIMRFLQVVYSDEDDAIDMDKSKFEVEENVEMVIGNRQSQRPSLDKQVEGWTYQDTLITFFPADTNISPREGFDADIVETIDGRRFRVNRTDFDNILNIRKQKVFLEPLRGGQQG